MNNNNINNNKQPSEEESGDWGSYLTRGLQSAASYLPAGVSEVLQQGRDFATAKLHSCGMKNIRYFFPKYFIWRQPFLSLAQYQKLAEGTG